LQPAVNGGGQVQVHVQVKADVHDHVNVNHHVNGLLNYPTSCN
jgi:hypothetical protein